MSQPSPRQPPRFVPTLTERVDLGHLAEPADILPAESTPVAPVPQEVSVAPVLPSGLLEQKINDWLDQWLAEHAGPLVAQLVDRIADDLRQALLSQARQAMEQGGVGLEQNQPDV